MRDELELGLEEPLGPDLVDHPVDARPGAAVLGRENFGRDPHPVPEIDLGLGVVVQGSRGRAEDRPIRVLAIVRLERQSHGFG